MENFELLAAVFYLAGGKIKGATRLHKLVFLIQQEVGLGRFQFKPSKYGPWSPDLEELVNELETQGLLKAEEVEDDKYRERPVKIFTATQDLLEIGKTTYEKLRQVDPPTALLLHHKVYLYSRLAITYLIAYVYRRYPEYAFNSTIWDKVKEWQRIYKQG